MVHTRRCNAEVGGHTAKTTNVKDKSIPNINHRAGALRPRLASVRIIFDRSRFEVGEAP